MTVSSTDRTAGPFIGSGVEVSFPFGFRVFVESDVVVVETDAAGVAATLVRGTDYTVAINADQRATPGGTVTKLSPLAAGSELMLTSDLEATQGLRLTTAGGFYPDAIEGALDKLTILIQQIGIDSGQVLRAPFPDTLSELPAAALRRDKLVMFDPASGDAEVSVFTASQVAALIAASSVSGISGGHIAAYESKTVTAGTTLVTLASARYTPGTSSILVFADGLVLTPGTEFLETSSSSITLVSAYAYDVELLVIVGRLVTSGFESTQVSHEMPDGSSRSQASLNDEILTLADMSSPMGLEVIAHRGFRDEFPQNTLLAMSMALSRGADSLECDVQITSDGVPVLFHDSTLDALTNGTGTVASQTLSYVQARTFDEVSGTPLATLRIPTFAEFLKYARQRGVFVYPEIKAYRTQADVALLVDAIEAAGMEDLCMLTSFTYTDITTVRSLNSKIRVGFVGAAYVTNYEAQIDSIGTLGRGAIVWDYTDLVSRPAIVSYALSKRVDVVAYTFDSWEQARSVTSLGVRKLIADTALGI